MQFIANNKKIQKKEKTNILQKELNTKEIIATIAISCAFIAYVYLFIYPKYTEYKESINSLSIIESNISTYENKILEMPVLQETLNSLNNEINVKSKILAHNMEDGMFLIGLSNLMKQLDVDMVDYSVHEYLPYQTFYAIPTTITVRGDYKNIREIMHYMEFQKNMTQILNYDVKSYIEDKDSNTQPIVDSERNEMINQIDVKPKNKGIVEATFNFIMYSSEYPKIELNNSDFSNWNPGKYNPFKSTI